MWWNKLFGVRQNIRRQITNIISRVWNRTKPLFDKPFNSLKVFCLNLVSFAFFYFCHLSWKSHPIKKREKIFEFSDAFHQVSGKTWPIPYNLFFAVKKNSFIHSKFHINFFFRFFDETETIFFHQSNCQNDQFWPIRVRREIFYIFALTLYNFRWFLEHLTS